MKPRVMGSFQLKPDGSLSTYMEELGDYLDEKLVLYATFYTARASAMQAFTLRMMNIHCEYYDTIVEKGVARLLDKYSVRVLAENRAHSILDRDIYRSVDLIIRPPKVV